MSYHVDNIKIQAQNAIKQIKDIDAALQYLINNNGDLKHLSVCQTALNIHAQQIEYIVALIQDIYNLSKSKTE